MKRLVLFVILLCAISSAFSQYEQNVTQWRNESGRWSEWNYLASVDTVWLAGQGTVTLGPFRTYPFLTVFLDFKSAGTEDSLAVTKVSLFQWHANSVSSATYQMDLEWKSPTSSTGVVPLTAYNTYSCTIGEVGVFAQSEFFWLKFITGVAQKTDSCFVEFNITGYNGAPVR